MKSQKGAVLVTVLTVSVILFIIIGGLLFLTSSEWIMFKKTRDRIRSFYIAEAGIDRMYVHLKGINQLSETERLSAWGDPGDGEDCSININEDFGGGTYNVTAQTKNSSTENITITSTGEYKGTTSGIKIEFKKGPKNPFEYLLAGGNIHLWGYGLGRWGRYVKILPDSHIVANGSITLNEYVQFEGGSTQTSNADIPLLQFLETMRVDTDTDGTLDTIRYVDLNARTPSANPNPDIPVGDDFYGMCNQLYDVNGDGDPENAAHPDYSTDPNKYRRDKNGDGHIRKADESYDYGHDNDNPFPNIHDPAVTIPSLDDPSYFTLYYYNDGSENPADKDGDGNIDRDDTHWYQWNEEFDNDDIDSNQEITEKDGFIYYYTETLGKGKNNLGPDSTPVDYAIAVDETADDGLGDYYSGSRSFGPANENIEPNKNIVFVNGDVDIFLKPTVGEGEGDIDVDLTIVTTGDVDMDLPLNRLNDRLNIIAYGNVSFRTTFLNGQDGFHTNIYSHGGDNSPSTIAINIDWGGRVDGCIVCNNKIDIGDLLILNRELKYNSRILSDLPAGFGFGDYLTEGSHPLYPYVPTRLKVGKKVSGSWERI